MSDTKIFHPTQPFISEGFLTLFNSTHKETVTLNDAIIAGRGLGCHLKINDPFASSKHFRVEKRGRHFVLSDLRSRNGTQVNGVQIGEAKLQDQDTIRVGNTEFLFSHQKESSKNRTLTHSKNEKWNEQLQKIPLMAQSQLPILIGGPSGSGKEIIAQQVHRLSQRSQGAFVSVNCSALSESLIESELFGHIKGSFTGALTDRKGAFESARGGTLFLDEIGDLPLSLQPKLLRALENSEIKPVGSDRAVHTDVRIVTASHKDIKKLVVQKRFREDLFYRINVIYVESPPLSQRMEDFETLVFYFSKQMRVRLSHSAILEMKSHPWPGNIRELKNTIAKAKALYPNQEITAKEISAIITPPFQHSPILDLKQDGLSVIKQMEKDLIIQSLIKHKGNQRHAADELNMPKSTLHDRLKTFQIDPKTYKPL